jgi:5-methylcytosine-specific restriction endonuclease McrA
MSDIIPQSTALKVCSKCGEAKPATTEYFNLSKRRKCGLYPSCKVCRRVCYLENRERETDRAKAYYEANRERVAAQAKIYRQENHEIVSARNKTYNKANAERIAAQVKAYNGANAERIAAQKKAYYEANRERAYARVKAYRKANPGVERAARQRRRARKANAQGTHTVADIRRQYKAQKGRCYYCGVKVDDTYHVDHVIPLSRGGANGPENLVIACPACNVSKGNKLPHEWSIGGRPL